MPYQIFIVEDHPVIRELYTHLLKRATDLVICGAATNGAQALAAISTVKPDLVLLDLGLPDMSGLEVLRELHRTYPTLAVLVVSGQGEALYAVPALQAGAQGYLDKLGLAETLLTAIYQVLNGEIFVTEQIRQKLHTSYI